VVLTRFTASHQNGEVQVSWQTASELNNRGFFIQRALDGKSFEDITFVKGAGNSSTPTTYTYRDVRAFSGAGANTLYYRLRQVDYDGKQQLTNLVIVKLANHIEAPVVYPNPFNEQVVVTWNTQLSELLNITLTDLTGKVVLSQDVQVVSGVNQVVLTTSELTTNGVYFLKVSGASSSTYHKLIKTN